MSQRSISAIFVLRIRRGRARRTYVPPHAFAMLLDGARSSPGGHSFARCWRGTSTSTRGRSPSNVPASDAATPSTDDRGSRGPFRSRSAVRAQDLSPLSPLSGTGASASMSSSDEIFRRSTHSRGTSSATASERALAQVPCHLVTDAFLFAWTQKEAFLKAIGLGLAADPSCVATESIPVGRRASSPIPVGPRGSRSDLGATATVVVKTSRQQPLEVRWLLHGHDQRGRNPSRRTP